MRDEHNAEHQKEDCEERAQGDEDTFAEPAPVTAVELTVLGSGVGLKSWCNLL